MKAAIHPKYYEATVKCSCGNTFTVGSTKPSIEVEICAKCHPFFTGEMRFVDTMGRVERFQQKMAAHPTGSVAAMSKKARKQLKQKEEEAAEAARPKSLKEMLDKVVAKA
jgi:large subunit ribosomal protein L31